MKRPPWSKEATPRTDEEIYYYTFGKGKGGVAPADFVRSLEQRCRARE